MTTNQGITVHDDGTIIAAGAEAVQVYAFLAARRMLRLEIMTGMKMSRGQSALQACKRNGWVPADCRTKVKALGYMNDTAVEMGLERI